MSKRAAGGRNPAHILFEKHLLELGITFTREFRFHPLRKWRFDYNLHYWARGINPADGNHAAVEIEGAIWANGRHTRGKGYQADLDKYNQATAMGFRVFRFSTTDVLRGRAKEFIKTHLLGGK